MRILRAGVALWALVEYSTTHDMLFLFFGGFFAIQAIFNVGCCGSSGCATSPNPAKKESVTKEVEFEEVK